MLVLGFGFLAGIGHRALEAANPYIKPSGQISCTGLSCVFHIKGYVADACWMAFSEWLVGADWPQNPAACPHFP